MDRFELVEKLVKSTGSKSKPVTSPQTRNSSSNRNRPLNSSVSSSKPAVKLYTDMHLHSIIPAGMGFFTTLSPRSKGS